MKLFLTSSPSEGWGKHFTNANAFSDAIAAALPGRVNGLFITSEPDDIPFTEGFGLGMKADFELIGVTFASYTLLDRRNAASAAALVRGADLIILAGGHVPTEAAFFASIGLKDLLQGFGGVVLGVSAGSMNAASLVYAQPERDGESTDPDYVRFFPGLGLTEEMILPHYNLMHDAMLDGRRLYEDITFEDSLGHSFLVLPDGSYLYAEDGREEIRGEAYRIRDGVMTRIF